MATPPPPRTQFSPDGMWWWTGTEWKPAISPDRRWRWNGSAWVPAAGQPTGTRSDPAVAVGVILGAIGIVVLVSFFVIVILLVMGNQIANVFDNVVTALNGG